MMYQVRRFVLSAIHNGRRGGAEVGAEVGKVGGGGSGNGYAEQWHTFLGHSVYATGGWITHSIYLPLVPDYMYPTPF